MEDLQIHRKFLEAPLYLQACYDVIKSAGPFDYLEFSSSMDDILTDILIWITYPTRRFICYIGQFFKFFTFMHDVVTCDLSSLPQCLENVGCNIFLNNLCALLQFLSCLYIFVYHDSYVH